MPVSSNNGTPIVEQEDPQGEIPDPTHPALEQRIRQQELLAELGVSALQGANFDKLLTDTVAIYS